MENRSSNRRLRVTQGGLAIRFALLLLGILVVAVGVYAAWSNADQQSASEQKVLEEARLLSQQMAASWNYVDSVQDSINYNSDGRYDFKGVYCSVAGKSIALRFTQKTDCIIRYTRENPRTGSDAPDSFEAEALAAFKKGETERYEIGEYEGEQVFRYASAIPIVYGCLQCHGTPEGELDETGYPKEGMQIGDIAGAVSIIIPMQQYQEEAAARTNANVMLFMALAVLIVAATSCGLYWWVTRPLGKLALAAQEVGSGRFDSMMSEVKGIGEIKALSSEFAAMERSLKSFYEQLEDQVSNRTEQLVVANEALAAQRDEISRINEQLTQANALLKRENEFQSAFLATMSHELRTPLASIIAFAEVWLRSPESKTLEDIALMREIKRKGKELLATINNSLDAASIEAQRFAVDIVAVDLLDLVNDVESTISPLAGERELDLSVEVDPRLPLAATDPAIVHKILINLLGNAVKFTEPGGSVKLALSLDETAQNLEFRVSDTGIGIPEEDLKLIFERFRQADSSISRKYGGSGLGLSLVKEMTELLGGSVCVSSASGVGSEFTVRIPYREVEGGQY